MAGEDARPTEGKEGMMSTRQFPTRLNAQSAWLTTTQKGGLHYADAGHTALLKSGWKPDPRD